MNVLLHVDHCLVSICTAGAIILKEPSLAVSGQPDSLGESCAHPILLQNANYF